MLHLGSLCTFWRNKHRARRRDWDSHPMESLCQSSLDSLSCPILRHRFRTSGILVRVCRFARYHPCSSTGRVLYHHQFALASMDHCRCRSQYPSTPAIKYKHPYQIYIGMTDRMGRCMDIPAVGAPFRSPGCNPPCILQPDPNICRD